MYSVWRVSKDTSNRRPTTRTFSVSCCFSPLRGRAHWGCTSSQQPWSTHPVRTASSFVMKWNAGCPAQITLNLSPAVSLSLLGSEPKIYVCFSEMCTSAEGQKGFEHIQTLIFFSIHLFMHPLGGSHSSHTSLCRDEVHQVDHSFKSSGGFKIGKQQMDEVAYSLSVLSPDCSISWCPVDIVTSLPLNVVTEENKSDKIHYVSIN